MFPHVPSDPLPFFTAVHAWQRPKQGVSQQTPSTQLLLAQFEFSVQGVPLGLSVVHAPLPLHVAVPAHSLSGSRPLPMFPHVPSDPLPFFAAVHAWQTPVAYTHLTLPTTRIV